MGGVHLAKEYAAERQSKRRRHAEVSGDSGILLEAIDALGEEIAALRDRVGSAAIREPADGGDATEVAARVEIAQMIRKIGQAKMEIASIKHPQASDDRMDAATNELDAIVVATETSTHDILAASERIEGVVRSMTALHPEDETLLKMSDEVAGDIIRIFEACNFQDITGQRITKVVNTIRYIEERILSVIDIWGREAFAELPLPEMDDTGGDQGLMNGPQLPSKGISQDVINTLFD